MTVKEAVLKVATLIFTLGAACALGFLSFVGMLALTPNIALAGTAFALAIAYEGQVYEEGIGLALRRVFSKDFLSRGIIQRYLQNFVEQDGDSANVKAQKKAFQEKNIFLKDYAQQKKYLEKLEELENLSAEEEKIKQEAKKRLRWMELFVVKQLTQAKHYHNKKREEKNQFTDTFTDAERAVQALLQQDFEKLYKEIQIKYWFLKISWLFAIAAGVSSVLTAMSSMYAGVAALTVLSCIPGGIFITVAALAGIGYTLLLYQAISDMVLKYGSLVKSHLQKEPDEKNAKYYGRCFATLFVVGLIILTTIATAGTWWFAAKEGAKLLNSDDLGASILRSITVTLMVLPNFIYGLTNSIESVDEIFESDYSGIWQDVKKNVAELKNETRWQIVNPFRWVDAFLMKCALGLYFLGHVFSIAVTGDRWECLPKAVSIGAGFGAETLEDLAYRPGKKSEGTSLLLKFLLFPVFLAANFIRVLAVIWDSFATKSLAKSTERMFHPKQAEEKKSLPAQPDLSASWKKQEVMEVSYDVIDRLYSKKTGSKKVAAAKVIYEKVWRDEKCSAAELNTLAAPLALHRHPNCVWNKALPYSAQCMEPALRQYTGLQLN